MRLSKAQVKAKAEQQQWEWRDELQALLSIPVGGWSSAQADKVEELASMLGYSNEDCFWRSF
jgi:hypothetical protein